MEHEQAHTMADDTFEFTFPVGYRTFHKKQLYNYQLNRPYSLGYARAEDLEEAGKRIGSFDDWKTEMVRQSERAETEGRLMNAAFHARAAEFYTFPDDPDKGALYERFVELFREAFRDHSIERTRVPYERAWLPIMIVAPEDPDGTIVLHGGYDSFIEEFYSLMRFFAAAGYRVVGFEGPGQGAARRRAGLPLNFRWEKAVGAVLNELDLDQVTLIGLSMGGYFALRAAAFEPRVARVVASGHAYDYRKVAPAPAVWLLEFFRDHLRDFTNRLSLRKIRKGGMEAWNISHLMYVTDLDEPMAALDFAFSMNEEHLHADRIRQDVLVLASREDHFIPFRLHERGLRQLTLARSVTSRVFTRQDHAQNHCQIGNMRLALDVMRKWIEGLQGGCS
jgi:pimeloyl-ACP methyl ester carboxylesterase